MLTILALPGCTTTRKAGEVELRKTSFGKSAAEVRANYDKHEYMIPMRDGVKLFTAVYTPKDKSEKYPILMRRTPYSCKPYGEDQYPWRLGPSKRFMEDGYIFVFQDVRGTFMSEGEFVNMTPHIDHKHGPSDIDESSDAYDTIDWLVKNIPNNNGRVGIWGISYPGFYSSASMIDHHPALVAVSPQAPIADWWYDDFHHHGAFFLPHLFNFIYWFGQPRPEPTKERGKHFDEGTPDGYQFFLDMGPMANANKKYFHHQIKLWDQCIKHPNYDEFWQKRNLLPHLHDVAPAVLTVGGWYDAEDLYGALQTYRSVEAKNPNVWNAIVMGPWQHGGWARTTGDHLGNISFGSNTSDFYREHILYPFFAYYLKGEGTCDLPEAYMFETGANRWRKFDAWPPKNVVPETLYLRSGQALSFEPPTASTSSYDEYVSDPAKPVPYSETISDGMERPYMTDDQRFAGRRTDVLAYQTEVLPKEVTLAGPIVADLWVSTSGTASDWVVKLIDVWPPGIEDTKYMAKHLHLGGYQQMVRSEVIRGRFRNSNEHPEPFVPNEPTHIRLDLQDVLHTFLPGHRIMVQIQSTWFPIVDRNPHHYADNVYLADESDFVKATQRVYHGGDHATKLELLVLPQPASLAKGTE